MPKSTQSIQVFLLYAHKDKEIVYKLSQRLGRDGINVWLDAERLQPGQVWEHEIRRAILKSDVVIACLSENFSKPPGYRHEELKIALEKANMLMDDAVFIIPVRLGPCSMPDALQHLQRVDLFESSGYKKLIRALQEHAK